MLSWWISYVTSITILKTLKLLIKLISHRLVKVTFYLTRLWSSISDFRLIKIRHFFIVLMRKTLRMFYSLYDVCNTSCYRPHSWRVNVALNQGRYIHPQSGAFLINTAFKSLVFRPRQFSVANLSLSTESPFSEPRLHSGHININTVVNTNYLCYLNTAHTGLNY